MAEKEDLDNSELLEDLTRKLNDWYEFSGADIENLRLRKRFIYQDQWDEQERQNRFRTNRPTLEFNKLAPIMLAILGEQRKNNISVEVSDSSTDLKTPQQTLDIYNDFAREVMARDDVQQTIQTVFSQFLEGGWGAARVILEYEKGTFNQTPRIVPINDQQSAFWDPAAQDLDKLDGDYCGVYQRMSKKVFKQQYPDIELTGSLESAGIDQPITSYTVQWLTDNEIVIAEIYVKEHKKKEIVLFEDGTEMDAKEAKKLIKDIQETIEKEPMLAEISGLHVPEIVDRRSEDTYKIKHYKFIKDYILEETEYPGTILPIPYGEGHSTVLEGRRVPLPFLSSAIDAQRLYNYTMSEIADSMRRQRKETWIAEQKLIEGNEEIWKNPDQIQGVLTYTRDPQFPDDKPERFDSTPFQEALLALGNYSSKDLQELTGRFEESRGQESNAMSGTAIAQRRAAGNMPINVYQDNLARFLKSLFRVVFDLFQNVMQQQNRQVLVRGKDGKRDVRTLNVRKGFKYNDKTQDFEPHIENDVKSAMIDVDIKVVGSLDEQRAQAVDFLLKLCQIAPPMAPMVGDLIAENSGFLQAQKLANRLQTFVDPKILAEEKGQPPPPPPPPPPPSPEVQAAQITLQGKQMEFQYKQSELQQKMAQMMIDAKAKDIDAQTAISKARAEVITSQNDIEQSMIKHATTMAKGVHDIHKMNLSIQQQRETGNGKTKR